MSADYYSDRVGTPRARTEEAISKRVWDALTAEVQTRVESGAFGSWFPRACPKSTETIGCDASVFWKVAGGHLPDWHQNEDELPPTLAILDFLEFCHERVADPVHVNYDAEFGHYHLGFYPAAGQENFRRDINAILTRNGLAYELESNGKIERIPPPVLREALRTVFSTGDAELDGLLNQAVAKYLSPEKRQAWRGERPSREERLPAEGRVLGEPLGVVDMVNEGAGARAALQRADLVLKDQTCG
jgi:hypothetical protein